MKKRKESTFSFMSKHSRRDFLGSVPVLCGCLALLNSTKKAEAKEETPEATSEAPAKEEKEASAEKPAAKKKAAAKKTAPKKPPTRKAAPKKATCPTS